MLQRNLNVQLYCWTGSVTIAYSYRRSLRGFKAKMSTSPAKFKAVVLLFSTYWCTNSDVRVFPEVDRRTDFTKKKK